MARFFFFVVAALCFFQVNAGRFIRETDATETNQLEEVSKQATAFLDNLGEQFNALIGAKDGAEVEQIVRNNTNTFISNIQELTKKLQGQLGSTTGEVNTVLGQAISRINATITDLQTQNPEMTAKAKEIQVRLQDSFKTVLKQADDISKQLNENTKEVREDIAKLTKQTYEAVLENAQKVQKDIHEAANKA